MSENVPPKGAPRDPGDQPYEPYGSAGGGGAGGNYVFTDLAHLDTIIARWQSVCEGVEANRRRLLEAGRAVFPPAKDPASVDQADALVRSVNAAWEHNESVIGYANRYVGRLQAVRAEYGATEEANTDHFRVVDGDGDR